MSARMEKYIAELLHYHDCVIVPGLGGFVANHKSAALSLEQHLFHPPVKEIGFNRSLWHHDGLLINHVAKEASLTYAEASVIVADFVKSVRERVKNMEVVDLGDVGSLRGDAIGNIIFMPNESSSFLPSAFGLSSFRFEPLDYRHVAKIESQLKVPGIMMNRSPWYYRGVAAMLAGFLMLSTFELKMPEVDQANISSALISSVATQPGYGMIEESARRADFVPKSDTLLAKESLSDVIDAPHHIIAASFKEAGPAAEAAARFVSEGFTDAHVVSDNAGRHRIAIQSFQNKQEALSVMNQLRKQSRFSTVWVHSQP